MLSGLVGHPTTFRMIASCHVSLLNVRIVIVVYPTKLAISALFIPRESFTPVLRA